MGSSLSNLGRRAQVVLLAALGGVAPGLSAGVPSALDLNTNAQATSDGVFLRQIARAASPLPDVLLAPAPPFGQTVTLTRGQIQEALERLAPDFATTNWLGAERVRVTRRDRVLTQAELQQLLTTTLQREYVKDRGELELRFARPWTPVSVPDEPLRLNILELPLNGISPLLLLRFELRTAHEAIGPWQAVLQARIWKEIWVAQSPLSRGELVRDAALARERRDLLLLHDAPADVPRDDASLELVESIPAGAPLLARVLKQRALVHRGQPAHALIRDGGLEVTMKVEVLEDGAPGQTVRARNPDSKREIRGKVLDEQTILVTL